MQDWIPRQCEARIVAAVADTPVVLLAGARQVGKSSLARRVAADRAWPTWVTLDDEVFRATAQSDPGGFIASLATPAVIDEVQREPRLLLAIKQRVDEARYADQDAAGMFVLTGSAELWMSGVAPDSLAGRIAFVDVHGLSQSELAGRPAIDLDGLLDGNRPPRPAAKESRAGIADRIVRGAFPEAVARADPTRRHEWLVDYARSLVDRDARDLHPIRRGTEFALLLRNAAASTACVRDSRAQYGRLRLDRETGERYLRLLERMFVLTPVPAWSRNLIKRLIRSPKLLLADTGLACALTNTDEVALADPIARGPFAGQAFETFVSLELIRAASVARSRIGAFHLREQGQRREIDLILERSDRRIIAIESKLSATTNAHDARHLAWLRDAVGDDFACGLVIYGGEHLLPLGDRLWAMPVSALWS